MQNNNLFKFKSTLTMILVVVGLVCQTANAQSKTQIDELGTAALNGNLEVVKILIEVESKDPNQEVRGVSEACGKFATSGCIYKNAPLALALLNFRTIIGAGDGGKVKHTSADNVAVVEYLLSLPEVKLDVIGFMGRDYEIEYNVVLDSWMTSKDNSQWANQLLNDSRFLNLQLPEYTASKGLIYAATVGHLDLAKYFVAKGATGKAQWVSKVSNQTACYYYMKHGKCMEPLDAAVNGGNQDIVDLIESTYP